MMTKCNQLYISTVQRALSAHQRQSGVDSLIHSRRATLSHCVIRSAPGSVLTLPVDRLVPQSLYPSRDRIF